MVVNCPVTDIIDAAVIFFLGTPAAGLGGNTEVLLTVGSVRGIPLLTKLGRVWGLSHDSRRNPRLAREIAGVGTSLRRSARQDQRPAPTDNQQSIHKEVLMRARIVDNLTSHKRAKNSHRLINTLCKLLTSQAPNPTKLGQRWDPTDGSHGK